MRKPPSPPAPAKIVALRKRHGLTQLAAAEIAMTSLRTWAAWEAGETKMHPGIWEWFKLQAGQLPTV